jgi:protein SCO1/2
MRYYILLLIAAVTLAGCAGSAKTENASANAKRYPFKGKVVAVDRTTRKATIDHEAIPGYMEAMTMDFPVHAEWVWDDLKPGSDVGPNLSSITPPKIRSI